MKKFRFLSLILALCMALTLLAACGEEPFDPTYDDKAPTTPATTEGTTAPTEAPDPTDPDEDFNPSEDGETTNTTPTVDPDPDEGDSDIGVDTDDLT